jgi:two-component system, OmpR family, sensor kinase
VKGPCGFWPRPHSLRARFTFANVAFLAAGLLLAAAASIAATNMVLVGEIDDSLKSSQSTLAKSSLGSDGLRQLCTLAGLLGPKEGSTVAAAFQQDLLIVLNRQGRPSPMCGDSTKRVSTEQRRVASAISHPAGLARSGDAVTVNSGSMVYRVVAIRLSDGTIVVRGMRLSGVRHAIGKLLIAEAGVGVVLLALLAAGSMTAARRRLSPLEDMVETASAISEGDLSRRIPTARHGSLEVEQLSTSLNAMLQQIETALTESARATTQLRQFLADASHELRTPLASVRGYLQLYEKGMLDADEQDRALGRVSAEALRMSRLVDELLALARLDDRPALALGPVDVACLVREAAADLIAQQPERPLTLIVAGEAREGRDILCQLDAPDPPGVSGPPGLSGLPGPTGLPGSSGLSGSAGLPAALGDEAGLRQVIGNLLSNVRVHTPADSPLTVEVAPHGDAGIRLRVSDSGPGLSAQDAARVFDRFFRSAQDRARDTGGAGLGMSIVRALVQAHQGTVALDTAPGCGLTVLVTLPVVSVGVPAAASVAVPGAVAAVV